MKAVDKFEWRAVAGINFFDVRYMEWIRQAITRAIADQARTIRISPVHMIQRPSTS